ncbi:twin-arginine translocase subunit TatB [Paroceanicella profunda]|uniref:Sec-independent protein translocase protein TatB n=1 Tax=Paroceanicella profunda TaxID=2579971 RepID=A0A5B8FZP8_9RHOB|nr:Sec-independent protein translocase protein TatB [Paroceanicella profunda]QDL92870.1 twin-arginine translocase subunit TatB [Paroceanicella profunda]
MFDIGWSELLVIGVLALLVVGPKDLPRMFHTVGQYVGKARGMAREFQRSMEDAAREAGMEDVAKAARSVQDVGRIAKGGTAGMAKFGIDKATKPVAAATTAKTTQDPAPEPEPAAAAPMPPAAATPAPAAATFADAAPAPADPPAREAAAQQPPGPGGNAS